MGNLSLFLSRDKAVRYFQEQGFEGSRGAVSLVISKDGNTLGWYYAYMGVYALSTEANKHTVLKRALSGYQTLVGGNLFLYKGQLHRYVSIKVATRANPAISLLIRSYSEVLCAADIEELGLSNKPYNLYGVINKDTNKVETFIWGAGRIDNLEHYYPVFEPGFKLNLTKQSLRQFHIGEEFKFQNRYWMVNTRQGALCLCELDIQLRRKMEQIHYGAYTYKMPEY